MATAYDVLAAGARLAGEDEAVMGSNNTTVNRYFGVTGDAGPYCGFFLWYCAKLTGLHLNGNNFVSDTPLEKALFDYNLSPVIISGGTFTEVHENMELNALQVIDGKWYFVLLDIPETELWKRKIDADMQYISMMTDVELD